MAKSPEFVVDKAGNRVKVILNLVDYRRLLEAQEELEDIRAYDEAKASGDKAIPFRPRRQNGNRSRK